jgi:hypothetical protein
MASDNFLARGTGPDASLVAEKKRQQNPGPIDAHIIPANNFARFVSFVVS